MKAMNKEEPQKCKVIVLYSWENNNRKANEWALALCLELNRYMAMDATCDMLWEPYSNIKEQIINKIYSADKIIVIITENYNKKIISKVGLASYEEAIYSKLMNGTKDKSKILFVSKEHNVPLPPPWKDYMRYDFSMVNAEEYLPMTRREQRELFENIVRFCLNVSEYEIQKQIKTLKTPTPKKVKTFEEIFIESIKDISEVNLSIKPLSEQEKELREYIIRNKEQEYFVRSFLFVGLAADRDFHGRMTPELFLKYFYVDRPDNEETKCVKIIRNLFESKTHNIMCIQSDGGSGKTVFIRSMSYRSQNSSRKRQKYTHNYIVFDLASTQKINMAKEYMLFQKFRKLYGKLSRDNEYSKKWRHTFISSISELKNISFVLNDIISEPIEFEKQLHTIIDIILPNQDISKWYIGYSNRLLALQETGSNIIFIIVLLLYLLALDARPVSNIEERYVMVFDNIETYDNGNATKWIANYIQGCHSYIRSIFEELGKPDLFFQKFTFIIVMRTSTMLPFGNQQSEIWDSRKNIYRLEFFDFTINALLLKLKFLKTIPNIESSLLYKDILRIVTILVPIRVIDNFIETGEYNEEETRYFSSHCYLPLFNNNYRRAMHYIYSSVIDEDFHDIIEQKIHDIDENRHSVYNYAINSIRMIIFRQIFHHFEWYKIFDAFGFSNLTGKEQHSITRVILSFLYWSEVKHCMNYSGSKYRGILLNELINTFRNFYSAEEISQVLYNLSLYAKGDEKKKAALDAWGELIVYENLDYYLNQIELTKVITGICKGARTTVTLDKKKIPTDNIYIKLSDAGMCFVQYYIRNYEFILSRSPKANEIAVLSLLRDDKEVITSLDTAYEIINNCISKLVEGGINVCELYGHTNIYCNYLRHSGNEDTDLLSCALFTRYQECLDLIRDTIDYIDRYRILVNVDYNDNDKNIYLLDYIMKFYMLYAKAKKLMLPAGCVNESNREFMAHWESPRNNELNNLLNKLVDTQGVRIFKARPIQSYYCRQNEDFRTVIAQLKASPSSIPLYQAILESLNIFNYSTVLQNREV